MDGGGFKRLATGDGQTVPAAELLPARALPTGAGTAPFERAVLRHCLFNTGRYLGSCSLLLLLVALEQRTHKTARLFASMASADFVFRVFLLLFATAKALQLPAHTADEEVISSSRGLTKFVPFEVQVSNGNSGLQKPMHILVPASTGEFQISHPTDLFQHVQGTLTNGLVV